MTHVDDGTVLASDYAVLVVVGLTYTLGRKRCYLGVQATTTDRSVLLTVTEYTSDTCNEYEVTGTKSVPADPDLLTTDKTLGTLDEFTR